MNIYLIRHTNIDIESGVCYGQTDIVTAATFDEEKKEVISKLPDFNESPVVFSSPLQRCTKLAKAFPFGEVKTDARLKELDFGEWERQKWDDIDSGNLQKWMNDFVNIACPSGESYTKLQTRVLEWWQELLSSKLDTVLVVTHGGVIRCLLSEALNLPLTNSFRFNIDYGGMSKINYCEPHYTVEFFNR